MYNWFKRQSSLNDRRAQDWEDSRNWTFDIDDNYMYA
jgi:hypothetical protein